MNVHKNARQVPRRREYFVRLVLSGQTPEAAARAAGVCLRTMRKWVGRFRAEGPAGLYDRSSRPHRLYRPTPEPVVQRICELRRQRWTGKQIAVNVGVSPATVSRVLKRHGLNKLKSLEPAEPVPRYERVTTSNDRAAELPIWLHRYNWHRPHGSLKSKPPASRLGLDRDNLLRLHS